MLSVFITNTITGHVDHLGRVLAADQMGLS